MKKTRERTWPPRTAVAAYVVLGLAVLGHTSAGGQVLTQRLTEEELARKSGFIVDATVAAVTCSWNEDGTQIYTFVELLVTDSVKGAFQSGDVLRLRILGGIIDDIGMQIAGAPGFQENEEALLFLGPNPETLFPVVGLWQGKFSIHADSITGERVITRTGEAVSSFLARIRAIVERQAEARQQAEKEQCATPESRAQRTSETGDPEKKPDGPTSGVQDRSTAAGTPQPAPQAGSEPAKPEQGGRP